MNQPKKIRYWGGVLPIAVFLVAWEIAARLNLSPGRLFLPPFSAVMREFYSLIVDGVLVENFLSSLIRVMIGFCAGSMAGLVAGILMGWKEVFNKTFSPIISLVYPIPALGWLPLLMLWIGINEMLPIAIIFICSFFPVLYNTITGIREVSKELINTARTLGASERCILIRVVLPLALPNIFTGLQLEAGMAWRVVIAAEMVAIPTGIGALMMRAESLVRVDIIIVCLIVLSFMCLLFERSLAYLCQKLTSKWK